MTTVSFAPLHDFLAGFQTLFLASDFPAIGSTPAPAAAVSAVVVSTAVVSTSEAVVQALEKLGCRIVSNEHYMMVLTPPDYSHLCEKDIALLDCAHGVILRKEDATQIVSTGTPKTYLLASVEQAEALFPAQEEEEEHNKKIVATVAKHGSVLRVFFCTHTNKWVVTTTSKLDAYGSFWLDCDKSIGQLFDLCLERIYGHKKGTTLNTSPLGQKMLDRNVTYHLLFQHQGIHRELVKRPLLFVLSAYSVPTKSFIVKPKVDRFPGLVQVEFKSPADMFAYFKVLSASAQNEESESDVVGLTFMRRNKLYKLLTPRHQRDLELLGNTPNPFLICLNAHARGWLPELYSRFPSFEAYSPKLKECFGKLTTMIVNGDGDEYIRPIVQELKLKNVPVNMYERVLSVLHNFHPQRLNFIFNGLEFIKTNDVTLKVPAAAPVPAAAAAAATPQEQEQEQQGPQPPPQPRLFPPAPAVVFLPAVAPEATTEFTEAEIQCLDEGTELENKKHTLFLTRKFKPYLDSELSIKYYEQGDRMPHHLDKYILSSLIHDMPPQEIALCLTHQWFMLDRIAYYYHYWRAQLEAEEKDSASGAAVSLSDEDLARYENYYQTFFV